MDDRFVQLQVLFQYWILNKRFSKNFHTQDRSFVELAQINKTFVSQLGMERDYTLSRFLWNLSFVDCVS